MQTLLTARPWLSLVLSLSLIVACGLGLGKLQRDVTTDALIPPEDVSNLNRKEIDKTFGIKDPIIVGIISRGDESIYSIQGFSLLRKIHNVVRSIENVRQDRVKSLVSEIAVSGTENEVIIENFLPESEPISLEVVAKARELINSTPLVQNALISSDETSALIVAELIDHKIADSTYQVFEERITQLSTENFDVVVAGQGAVSGYFNKYLSKDTSRMTPLAVIIMILVLLVTFRSFKAAIGPLFVILGTVAVTIGLKGWLGVSYFVITSSLPVLLLAIAVADSIHLLSVYFEHRVTHRGASHKASMRFALSEQAVPITLTSVTSSIGFLALALFSSMPPMYYFGVFAAVGVLTAWVLTLVLLPAITLLLKLEPSGSYLALRSKLAGFTAHAMISSAVKTSAQKPWVFVVLFSAATVALAYFMTYAEFDRKQVENFTTDAPIRKADELINDKFAGTSYLEVMVRSSEQEGMLSKQALNKVVELQSFMGTLPGVQKTQSILNYLDSLDRAFQPKRLTDDPYRLPDDDDASAQYVLFLESSGDPTALRDKIDGAYQAVLVRAYFNDSSYKATSDAVLLLREYVSQNFKDEDSLSGVVGGRLNVDYSWMSTLEGEHANGVLFSLFSILVFSWILFRSISMALLAVIPVVFSIISIYGVMGLLDVKLEPATSMFACISLGLGVDFGIHFVHRLRKSLTETDIGDPLKLSSYVAETARACYFNAAALTFGFLVLLFGQLPTVNRFGGLIALAATASFLGALYLLPALFQILRRRGLLKS